jgi:hypothetical protein
VGCPNRLNCTPTTLFGTYWSSGTPFLDRFYVGVVALAHVSVAARVSGCRVVCEVRVVKLRPCSARGSLDPPFNKR